MKLKNKNTISPYLKECCKLISFEEKLEIAEKVSVTVGQVKHVINRQSYNQKIERLLIPLALRKLREDMIEKKLLKPKMEKLYKEMEKEIQQEKENK